ncbi:putative polysaccharide synthase Cps1 [Xylaria bambusicola]|uniref:putative polysaccharide synthase Cps1 n=1 Tax=Xylaria bambusicola TaxID=326684 RepID=UPI00200868D6|nr:putative polysaccharide synthase Cps1 [Xylaria bambusicola]KAI0526430.1 putative polysaccharide synthase Cps1 [Xylaria bambusicola]
MISAGKWLFWALFTFRYLRTIASIFIYLLIRPKVIHNHPRYTGKDVTVVIPTTFKSPPELIECLHSIKASSPSTIIIVTSDANVELLVKYCRDNSFEVTALGVSKLNKREQILRAMPLVKTAITVLADDDVFWPERFLEYLLAVFEDAKVGAGGPMQRVRRNERPDGWNFLGISYLERRVWNNLATNGVDGSISTLSGRTAAYRTKILQSDEFAHYFRSDSWKGKKIHTGDDKCLTRYVYSRGWKIAIQPDCRATIETTVEPDRKYISQCIRWARSHWHGNFVVMTEESYWYSPRYFWGLYYIYVGQFQTPALLVDGLLFFFLWLALRTTQSDTATVAYASLGAWIFFTKLVKLIPHFWKYPSDLKFIPLSILFSYLHGFISLYALWTLDATQWGSQNLSALEAARADTRVTSTSAGKYGATKDETQALLG